MSNYFDNQNQWSWTCNGQSVIVETAHSDHIHGDHIHRVDITNATIGDMYDKTGQIMGDAHRAASHD